MTSISSSVNGARQSYQQALQIQDVQGKMTAAEQRAQKWEAAAASWQHQLEIAKEERARLYKGLALLQRSDSSGWRQNKSPKPPCQCHIQIQELQAKLTGQEGTILVLEQQLHVISEELRAAQEEIKIQKRRSRFTEYWCCLVYCCYNVFYENDPA